MDSERPRLQAADHVTFVADALVFSIVAGAVLVLVKNAVNLPAPWTDSLNAFHITMTLGSIAGAGIAWTLHRRHTGARGMLLLAVSLAAVIASVYVGQGVVTGMAASSPNLSPILGAITQAVGLAGVLAMLAIGILRLFRPVEPGFDYVAVARLAALALIAGYIAVRFLPETTAGGIASPFYAIMGFATSQGGLGALLSDGLAAIADRAVHQRR